MRGLSFAEVHIPLWVSLQPALLVSLHGGPAVVYVDIDVAELPPAVLRQPVGHVLEEGLTGEGVAGKQGEPLQLKKLIWRP